MKKFIVSIFAINVVSIFFGFAISRALLPILAPDDLSRQPPSAESLPRDPSQGPHPERDFPLVFAVIVATVFSASSLSAASFVRYLRSQAEKADFVMGDLLKGKLKSRFEIQKFDEISKLMMKFNAMADEIERLTHLRLESIQEVAHDLRSPLTSIRIQLENLQLQFEAAHDDKNQQAVSPCLAEVEYLSQLSEDLVVLARLETPLDSLKFRPLSVEKSLDNVVGIYKENARIKNIDLHFDKKITNSLHSAQMFVDANIWDRVIRNALGNSLSYAQKRLQLTIEVIEKNAVITIEDDGPGWPQSVFETFGQKRFMRGPAYEGRPSLGLGAVIIKSGVEAMGGEIKLSQCTGQNNQLSGARLELRLPITEAT